eukprot:TRINITY_DN4076_c0_g1_i1.p2 TRINITY_DN4076_c0_g1~~TRINITY_DN4076_c0_g1_i1.p2  ORF type:complete len:58 (+),score=10.91 TRINITY_DN4076_c0_g1_i1:302-475(+)
MHDPTPQFKKKLEKNGIKIGRETEVTCPKFNISFEFEKSNKHEVRNSSHDALRVECF